MSDETPRLKLAQLVSLQELNAVTWNEALAQLDALVDLCLLGQFVNTPPASPQDGDAYLTGGAPSGAWSGQPYKIAACLDGAWRLYQPFNGLRAFVVPSNTVVVYLNGSWNAVGSTDFATKSGSETFSNKTISGAANTLSNIPNAALVNPQITIAGHAVALGASQSLAAADVGLGSVTNDAQTKAAIVPNTAPAAGQLLIGNGSAYAPVSLGGDGTLAANGALSLTKIGGKAVTLGGAVTFSGAYGFTATLTNTTTVTFPVSGTLATLAGSETFTNKTFGDATYFGGNTQISAAGNLGIGAAPAAGWNLSIYDGTNTLKMSPNYIGFNRAGANYFAASDAAGTFGFVSGGRTANAANSSLYFNADGSIQVGYAVLPYSDNTLNLGSASRRFQTVFAGTGTINTSDSSQKADVRAMSAAELACARDLAGAIAVYRWNDALAAKGENARLHVGLIANAGPPLAVAAVDAICARHGLEPDRWGFFCRDRETVQSEDPQTGIVTTASASNPDGTPKYVCGLRYGELLAFIVAGLTAQQHSLAARIAALEEAAADGAA